MKFLKIVALSFVLIASSALAMSNDTKLLLPKEEKRETREYAPVPVIGRSSSFPVVSSQAALALDLDSSVTLYEKNPDSPFLPASTTKIITALVAREYYPLNSVLKVPRLSVEGQKMGLVAGEEITVNDLLYGLLVYSANDAAETLALNFPGGRDLFIAAMNIKVRQLNLEHSKFSNPAGLDDGDGHVTTARDLVRVSEIAMRDPIFREIVGTKEKVVRSRDGRIAHRLTNINALLGEVPGVLGVKTGWTENARENLVTYLERDGKRIMIVLLGSQDRFGETREIIDWIFTNYSWEEVKPPTSLRNTLGQWLGGRR